MNNHVYLIDEKAEIAADLHAFRRIRNRLGKGLLPHQKDGAAIVISASVLLSDMKDSAIMATLTRDSRIWPDKGR